MEKKQAKILIALLVFTLVTACGGKKKTSSPSNQLPNINSSSSSSEISYVTLTLNANGGVGSMDDIIVELGEFFILPSCSFTKEGYAFIGWNKESNGSGTSYSAGDPFKNDANITLYAQWDIADYLTLVLNSNGGVGTMDDISFEKRDVVILPVCQYLKEGYFFIGWNTAQNGEGTTYAVGDSYKNNTGVNDTLYAQWLENSLSGNPGDNTGEYPWNQGE